jgi:sphinganine C4-monooxygenase
MWFFTCSTIKTVDDHSGYAFPWDPLQHITSNNAAYHDIHHQGWGIKTNFSQPFFTFWDRLLGTRWTGDDVSAKYERSRIAAEKLVEQDKAKSPSAQLRNIQSSIQQHPCEAGAVDGAKKVFKDEDESSARNLLPRSVRRKAAPFASQSDSLKGISHRMTGSIRQK